jgi:hypothetical protein
MIEFLPVGVEVDRLTGEIYEAAAAASMRRAT